MKIESAVRAALSPRCHGSLKVFPDISRCIQLFMVWPAATAVGKAWY
jgi:hypothetical protein